jgi:DNA-binding CsgD family transcriptional regulator/tetratricopeptide (TPR) repeat protein
VWSLVSHSSSSVAEPVPAAATLVVRTGPSLLGWSVAILGGPSGAVLRGRGRECATLDGLVADTRAGTSSVLVLRGEPGIGKSALLGHVLDQASGCRVVRAQGVESEMEIAFAGLSQVCAPLLVGIGHLPGPQRDALRAVFGLRDSGPPGRFLVGLAVLTLLTEAAAEQPLICLIDDAQWLDRASLQALAFVARRLQADPVAMVFAEREPSEERLLDGLPELLVRGIGEDDARLLLASAMPGWFDERVADRILVETRGNPLALLEAPSGSASADLAGGFGLPGGRHVTGRIEQGFLRRARALPGRTQQLLLAAAADPVGDPSLLWRAAAQLGVDTRFVGPAVDAGLVELDGRVKFRHPLVRSAVYRSAPVEERRVVHRALAAATDPAIDPDRRAWHRAHAASGPDEAVAEELERSAVRAQGRGGMAAAAAFLECATELTPDPVRRGRRALAAARASFEAGAPDRASELLSTADLTPLDQLQRAQLERLRAQLAFIRTRGAGATVPLLRAARHLEPLDVDLARETHLEALASMIFAGRFLPAERGREVSAAAASAPVGSARAIDLLVDALATRFTHGHAAAVPRLQRALAAFRRSDGESARRWLWLASRAAPEVWDDDAWYELAARQLVLAREAGSLTLLTIAVNSLAHVHVHTGDLDTAAALLDEEHVLTEVTGSAPVSHTLLVLTAWRGDADRAAGLIDAQAREAAARGEGRAVTLAEYATAVLSNGLGHYEAALAAARRACEHDEVVVLGWALVELIEAAARSGRTELAEAAHRRLAARAVASGTDWALGVEARSRALLREGGTADALHREAIERLGRSRAVPQLARAHLVYGEWLRREGRRVDGRAQLRAAHELFTRMGARAFAERAGRELLATGERVRRRTDEPVTGLTAQELQVARLARDGHTNPEIGAQLYLSARTVEWHLRKVFTKLDISSRRDLQIAIPVSP